MTAAVVYLDPGQDLDEQRQCLRERFIVPHGYTVIAEHTGGFKAAEAEAYALGVPLIASSLGVTPVEPNPAHPAVLKRKDNATRKYEALRHRFEQAELLGLTTLRDIADYFTAAGVPLPSGKKGKWQATQVKRAREWLGERQ